MFRVSLNVSRINKILHFLQQRRFDVTTGKVIVAVVINYKCDRTNNLDRDSLVIENKRLYIIKF